MIEYKEPENLPELVSQISARPAMFVGDHNFDRVASFIDGYIFAREKFGILNEWRTVKDFSLWLAKRLDRPKNWAWFGILKDYYRDDEKALEMLPELFNEFLNTK